MLSRMTTIVVLSALVLNLGFVSTAGEKKGGFDALDDFEKDFLVAFGDAKSWKVNKNVFECNGKLADNFALSTDDGWLTDGP